MKLTKTLLSIAGILGLLWTSSPQAAEHHQQPLTIELSDADLENIVRRSLQYVALYDTLLNFTFNKKNPFSSGGWNKTHYPEGLMDASVCAIGRPPLSGPV